MAGRRSSGRLSPASDRSSSQASSTTIPAAAAAAAAKEGRVLRRGPAISVPALASQGLLFRPPDSNRIRAHDTATTATMHRSVQANPSGRSSIYGITDQQYLTMSTEGGRSLSDASFPASYHTSPNSRRNFVGGLDRTDDYSVVSTHTYMPPPPVSHNASSSRLQQYGENGGYYPSQSTVEAAYMPSVEYEHGAETTSSQQQQQQQQHQHQQGSTADKISADRKISCLECRSSKVKCSGQSAEDESCERCKRIKRPCIFERHRRGRKPQDSFKIQRLEQSVDTIMTAIGVLEKYRKNKEALREMMEDSGAEDDNEALDEEEEDVALSIPSPAQHRKNWRKRAASGGGGRQERSQSLLPRTPSDALLTSVGVAQDANNDANNDGNSSDSRSRNDKARSFLLSSSSQSDLNFEDPMNQAASQRLSVPLDDGGVQGSRNGGDSEREGDEIQELGLPPMSNPLRLLAQASDSALDGPSRDSQEHISSIEGANQRHDYATPVKETPVDKRRASALPKGVSRRGYWAYGMYSSRLDKGPAFDPISCGIVTKDVAKDLFALYMRKLNAPITLLDPHLHSFQYVRTHSALLLTSACALAARFASHVPNAEEVAQKLDTHVRDKLLPAVLLEGYRSVEISQAFIILAAYHLNTNSIDGDRSWSLVGYGIRIAVELDMNARLLSERSSQSTSASKVMTPNSASSDTPAPSAAARQSLTGSATGSATYEENGPMSAEEALQRKLRNRERTWCNLWLFENSLATHMGRRTTLSDDPVTLGVSAGWNRATYAIPGDEAIVAIISLRRMMQRNREYFEHSVLANRSSGEDESAPPKMATSTRFQLDFYRKSCAADLEAWRAAWVRPPREGEQSLRMGNGRLYAAYACLILNSYPLKSNVDFDSLKPIYAESYNSAMTYLTLFTDKHDSSTLVFVHNSAVVTVAYVAVFALKLCQLDPVHFSYIDHQLVFDLVEKLALDLSQAGKVTSWRNGAASSYGIYLSDIVTRIKRQRARKDIGSNDEDRYRGQNGDEASQNSAIANAAHHSTNTTFGSANRSLSGSLAPPLHATYAENTELVTHLPTRSASEDSRMRCNHDTFQQSNGAPLAEDSLQLSPEAMTYVAGPSGVQATVGAVSEFWSRDGNEVPAASSLAASFSPHQRSIPIHQANVGPPFSSALDTAFMDSSSFFGDMSFLTMPLPHAGPPQAINTKFGLEHSASHGWQTGANAMLANGHSHGHNGYPSL